MKKIFCGIALLICTASFGANPPVDEKVSRVFEESFPHVTNEKWYEYETFYEVLFQTNEVFCRVKYDLEGKLEFAAWGASSGGGSFR